MKILTKYFGSIKIAVTLSIVAIISMSAYAYTPSDTLYKLLKSKTDLKELTQINNELGWNLLFRYPDSAKTYIDKALELAEQINDNKAKAMALTNLGYYHSQHGDYISSGNYLSSARNIAEKEKDELSLAIIYTCLAGNYDAIKLSSKSIEFHRKSYEISARLQREYYAYFSLVAIASALVEEKRISSAEEYLQKLSNVNLNYHYTPLALEYYFTLAKISLNKKDYEAALKYLDSAHSISWDTGNMFGQVKCNNLYSMIYFNLNKFNIALKYAKTAEKISNSIDDHPGQIQLYRNMALIYQAKGDFKSSNSYFFAFEKIKDSLFNEGIINKIQIIQSQFEFDQSKSILEKKDFDAKIKLAEIEQQQKYIFFLIITLVLGSILSYLLYLTYNKIKQNAVILEDRNEEINQISETLELQNQDLELLNATKDKFFSIIGHDLRNPIGGIKNLTDMLISNISDFQVEEKQEILLSINKSIINTYALLENLLQWAKAQSDGLEFSEEIVYLNSIIKRNIELISHSATQKNILIQVGSIDVKILGDYNMTDTIIRNLLSNAVKFTPNSGNIHIFVTAPITDSKFVEIHVKDDGVGMSKNRVAGIFDLAKHSNTRGTNNETGSGLGLLLCKEFVEIMGGKIWVESEEGKGSTFIFTLPAI